MTPSNYRQKEREEGRKLRLDKLAERFRKGDAVPEPILYGQTAVELVRYGHLSESELTPYRSAAFFARRNFYSEDAALAWEREQKQAHEDALRFFGCGFHMNFNPEGEDQ